VIKITNNDYIVIVDRSLAIIQTPSATCLNNDMLDWLTVNIGQQSMMALSTSNDAAWFMRIWDFAGDMKQGFFFKTRKHALLFAARWL
jgi:hypothetical protein